MKDYYLIEDRTKIKSREILFDGEYYTTYLYTLKNGNKIKETEPKWKRKDFKNYKAGKQGRHVLNSSF